MEWIVLLKTLGPHVLNWAKSFFARKQKILIIGAGGVGKSTMAEFLAANLSVLKLRTEYNESHNTDVYKVSGHLKAVMHVVAGQAHRREATWGELLENVRSGEVDGVVLLNAFGFHSIGNLGKQGQGALLNRLKAENREDHFLEEYLKLKREEEIEVLRYIAPYLKARDTKHKLWMLSLVTKEDLWFHIYDHVREHYASGTYSEIVDDIRSSLGNMSFRHEIVTMSMLIKDFVTGRNETLAKTNSEYDQEKQVQSARNFFDAISSLS